MSKALKPGPVGFGVVKCLVLCLVEQRLFSLALDFYPYLQPANVEASSAAS